eukprot:5658647-Prymnesium_polylepis.1
MWLLYWSPRAAHTHGGRLRFQLYEGPKMRRAAFTLLPYSRRCPSQWAHSRTAGRTRVCRARGQAGAVGIALPLANSVAQPQDWDP